MKSLIIFAGAGASRGVSGTKYPMALDFRKRLPETITQSPLYRQLANYLGNRANEIDIEHVLWELGRLNETLRELTERDRFASQLLSTNEIAAVTGPSYPGPQVH